jgi:TRAP-type C4-dicarboxylate transport system permease small subunit
MKTMIAAVTPALRWIARISLWISATGLVVMTAFVAWQVFGRFVLNDTPTWTETGSILIMGWFIFLGAAVGIREGYHLSFDVVLYFLPERGRQVLYTISDIAVLGFAGCMVAYGAQLAAGTWRSTVPNLGVSGGVVFLALIAGGLLMSLFSLERLLRRAAGLGTARFGESMPDDL